MTEQQLDNIKIATRALTYFVVPMGMFFVCSFAAGFFLVPDKAAEAIYPHEASDMELFFSYLLLLPLFLAFTLPIIVTLRAFQNRRELQIRGSILN